MTPADLGPVFTAYRNDPEGAIDRLMRERTGDARAAWVRADLGAIDLIYGNAKAGLAKIAAKHPEMLEKLPNLPTVDRKADPQAWGTKGALGAE